MISRKSFTICSLVASTLALAMPAASQGIAGNWRSTWSDEFNQGSSDLRGWRYDLGNGGPALPGWGNGELENYTNDASNVSVSGGSLHITAQAGLNHDYTSGRIKTDGLFSQTYGLIEFRAKLPAGQGLWPAVWMLPQDNAYGGWPTSGEIDILESRGQDPTLVQGTLHSGPAWWEDHVQTGVFAGSGQFPSTFSTHDWHTYDLEWTRGDSAHLSRFTWYVDGIAYSSIEGGWFSPNGAGPNAPFDKPFYLLINMAVGGGYAQGVNLDPGSYDMQVDYVRAYSQATPEPATLAAFGLAALTSLLRRQRR